MYHSFLIHSSADGHLGCFHVLSIVNSAAMNIGVHVSFSIMVSSGYMPSSGTVGPYDSFIPQLLRIFIYKINAFVSSYPLLFRLNQFTSPSEAQAEATREKKRYDVPGPLLVCHLNGIAKQVVLDLEGKKR